MTTIAHLVDDAAVGGVNRMLADQTRALGHSFDISQQLVTPRRPLPPRIGADIAIVHFTPSWSKLPFSTLLRAQRPDSTIIHIEHTFTRNFEAVCVPSPRRFRKMLQLTYRLADVVVAVSQGQAAWMLEADLVSPGKLVVIQPSVDLAPLMSLPGPNRNPAQPLRIAAYGRYCKQKGFDVLIAAMRLLPPQAATLTIAGYGSDEADLRAMAHGMPNVHIGGAIDNLASFLSMHDAVVIPSRWEAFGLVATEARAAALPVIACNADGLSEQISDTYGLTTDVDDPAQLAVAIGKLLGSDLNRMGASARASVANHHQDHLLAWTRLLHRHAPASQLAEAA